MSCPHANMKHSTLLLCFSLFSLSALFTPSHAEAQTFASHSVLSQGNWYQIAVKSCGIHKLTTSDIPALNGLQVGAIALYGNDGAQYAESNSITRPDDLKPNAILVHDENENGIFDHNDYILFYAEGPRVWRYSSEDQRFEHHTHAYANYNYYYLNTESRITGNDQKRLRIQQSTTTAANRPDITTFVGVAVVDNDLVNVNNSGQIWVGERFSANIKERSYTLNLPSVRQGEAIKARYAFYNTSSATGMFEVKYNADARQHNLMKGSFYQTILESFTARTSSEITLNITYTPRENSATAYWDYIELNTNSPLYFNNHQLTIRNIQNLGTGNASKFIIYNGSANIRVWDVTVPDSAVLLPTTREGSSDLSFIANTEVPGTYIAFDQSQYLTPAAISALPNQDIHGNASVDYVIVTHKDFAEQAERLADLHRIHDGMSVLVVKQEDVFNEFSSGKPDPLAIRQLMRCVKSRQQASDSTKRLYLLLFGKGTFDNRNLLGYNAKSVITYESPTSFDSEGGSYASDDPMGYLDTEESGLIVESLDVSIGRLPAKSVAEAKHMVDKIEAYIEKKDLDRNDTRGDWRNFICLLADDADPSCPGDTNFAHSSEYTASLIGKKYPQYNIDRIYADAYIQQSGAIGSFYPDVNNALRQRMDYGCLLINYVGHGAASYIGTERYIESNDINNYKNTDRLAFLVASTCSYGHFDNVEGVCGAEEFLLAKAAGIGVVAATRPISHNQKFDTDVCLNALNPDNTIGDALRLAKNATATSHSISLLGDPALKLSFPTNNVVVTKINDHAVDSAVTDTGIVLSRVTVEGDIRRPDGSVMTDFTGEIFPIVFDRVTTSRTLANDNDSTEVTFQQQKNILYKGRDSVCNGHFSYSFIVPRDVLYHYDYGKLTHYARCTSLHTDASGQYGNIVFGGFNENVTISELHPSIDLYINDTNFRSGGSTSETPTLYAILSDSVGINAVGSGIGHDITATIDGNSYSTISLNDYFETDLYDSRNGTIRYTLGKLSNGPHTLTLKCWNIFNYSSSKSIRFVVRNASTLQTSNLCIAPNPSSDRTTIRIEHNQPDSISSVTIRVLDRMGRCVKTFTPRNANGSCVIAVKWDFRGDNGFLLPKGIYTLQAVISTCDGQQSTQVSKIVRN